MRAPRSELLNGALKTVKIVTGASHLNLHQPIVLISTTFTGRGKDHAEKTLQRTCKKL